jgi:DNA gyrase subunit A
MIPFKDYEEDQYLIMATRNGLVKKTSVMEYENIRKSGLIAISLREDDELIEVKLISKEDLIYLITRKGMSICFRQSDVRATGRSSMGVIGITLTEDDAVVSMQASYEGSHILIVSEKGLGKRTLLSEFTVQHRGGKGLKCYKIMEKTGQIVGAKCVNEGDELMIITSQGVIIRMAVADISILKRVTSGVKLVQLDESTLVASFARITEDMIEVNEENADSEEEEDSLETEEQTPSDSE